MRPMILHLAVLLLLAVAPGVVLAAPPAADEAALQRAMDHYHAGKLVEAAGLLRGFIDGQAGSPLVDEAYYSLARIHRELGEPGLALDYLKQARHSGNRPEALLLQSELLLTAGDSLPAAELLLGADTQGWPVAERQERGLALAEAFTAFDQPLRALFFYHQAFLTEGRKTPQEVLARAYTLLSERFDDPALAEAAFTYAEQPTGQLAMLQLGWRALAAGQKDLAQQMVSAVLAAPAGFAYRGEALTLQSRLTGSADYPQRAVGVLLPLSGRYAAFGKEVQRGMILAQEAFVPPSPTRFIYRDTAGEEAVAEQQVAELAIGERVIALAGPLVGNAAVGAARRANLERLPLLTLSQRDGLTASSLYVFRNSLTPQLQVRALLDYAIGQRGFTRFGILNPQTRQGELFAGLFRDEVQKRGGVIVAEQGYPVDQTDFRYQVRLLRGLSPNMPDDEGDEVASGGSDDGKTPPPFNALFLPDYADRISLIVPQLAFYGLDRVQLLGTSGWNDAGLPGGARQTIEGAVFTDGFFRGSSSPHVQSFVARFVEKYGAEPTLLEAQGYDVAMILLEMLDRHDVLSREDVRRELARMPTFHGVTGATRFDALGEAEKELFLLQIQNGTIIQIN